jgi:DNA-binding transcriptional ArsR family regulator
MSKAKYPNIAVDLETKINDGTYEKKIPGTRELATEYMVSKQTITNALRPLIQKGLLKSEGRRGVMIYRKQQKHGLLCIVATGDMAGLNADPELYRLQEYIREDGFDVILISTTSKDISCRSICKLLSNNFIGVIFTNSSLTLEIAEFLEAKEIPFVSCNRLPIYSHLNWVEYDWSGTLKYICSSFADSNHSRQALYFQGRLESYNILVRKEWQKLKYELNLPKLAIDRIELDYRAKPLDCFKNYLKTLREIDDYPQLLILWMDITPEVSNMICNSKNSLPSDCTVVGVAKSNQNFPEQIKTYTLEGGYYDLMLQTYKALKEKIIAPSDKFIHRFISNPVKWNQPMPFD